jgi:hypothetical protein
MAVQEVVRPYKQVGSDREDAKMSRDTILVVSGMLAERCGRCSEDQKSNSGEGVREV